MHVVRGLVLLLLMTLGQAEMALAFACEQYTPSRVAESPSGHADHSDCTSPHHEAPGRTGSSESPSCPVMLACGAAVALPSLPVAVLPAFRATVLLSDLSLHPPSRAESPANPPPRA